MTPSVLFILLALGSQAYHVVGAYPTTEECTTSLTYIEKQLPADAKAKITLQCVEYTVKHATN